MAIIEQIYNTQTEADTFVRVYNLQVGRHIARTVRVAPGQYQVWLTF